MALRRLTCRMPTQQAIIVEPDALIRLLSTIMSPIFCEFVLDLKLEVNELPTYYTLPPSEDWSRWVQIDKFLEDRFAKNGPFKVIVRTNKPHNRVIFQSQIRRGFPLLARRKCVHSEIFDE